jgi:tight adherence protein B
VPPILIVLILAAAVALLLMGGSDDKEVRDRMNQFASPEGMMDEETLLKEDEERNRKKATSTPPLLQGLGNIFTGLTPEGMVKNFQERLEKADVPLRANEFAAVVFLSMCAGFLFGVVKYRNLTHQNFAGGLFAVIGAVAPFVWLRVQAWRRLRTFNGQMLDTLLLLSNAIKAGYSLLQAMEMIARESPAPMGKEFARVVRETGLGVTVEDALVNMRNRVPSDDLDLMVTVVLIQRQIGGNLSEILDKIAHVIRERARIMGQISTLTAQGRISGAVIGLMPVGLGFIISLINPGYINVLFTYDDGAIKGWYLIVVGIILELIGFFFIWKIIDIEV